MKTVCITGAYGFIGRHVARLYASKGWHVVGIGHGSWSREGWQSWGISDWHLSDITLDSMLTYAGRPDLIVHCAGSGSVSFSMDHPFQDFQRTVDTIAAVLEFIRLYTPSTKLVYPSSAGVYGVADQIPIKESDALRPISPYGIHKKMAEDLCLSYAKHFGIAAAVVRLFSVYGNTLRKQLLWDTCLKLDNQENTFFGSGLEKRDWLHIDDAATLLFEAGNNASADCPVINGGTGKGVTVSEIVAEIFRCYESSQSPEFTGITRPGDPVDYVADISKARQWGWKPLKTWQEGTKDYVEWYKDGAC